MPETLAAKTEPVRPAKFTRNEIAIASAIVLTGLALRIRLAVITYLNPDEASHALSSFGSWKEMFFYASRVDKHPPLLLYLTHLVTLFSRSELALRMIPILASVLCAVFSGIWLRRVAGKRAALTALFLLVLSPHFVVIGAQLRSYSLAFMFVSASLVALEIALDTGRLLPMVVFDVLLFLCICSDYSMVLFAGPAGIYALMRLRAAPRSLRIAWAAGQPAPLAVCIQQVFSNAHRLPHTWGFLARGFPRNGVRFWFPVVNTAELFGYAMGSLPLGILAWLLFSAGVFLLWTDRTPLPRERARGLAIFLLLPFLLGLAAALAGVFPYGALRHSMVIGIFAAGGVGILSEFSPRLPRPLFAGIALAPILIWIFIPNLDPMDIPPWRNRRTLMLENIAYMRATIPPGAAILSERETALMLLFYQGGTRFPARSAKPLAPIPVGPWLLRAREYRFRNGMQVQTLLHAFRTQEGLKDSDTVWILDGGFGIPATESGSKRPLMRAVWVYRTP
jgi:4-amino-4-deoxy-L-arabinose transferase-like glycosyltransferase